MSAALSPAAQRFQMLLREAGSSAEVVQFSETARSAAEAAAAIGCEVAQIAKSVIFRAADDHPVLVVASGPNRVDEKKVAAALGQKIGRADADYVRRTTGYAIGGVAPIGHSTPPHVFIDRDLGRHASVWAAAGHPHAVFETTAAELERLTGGVVLDVA